MKKLLFIFIIFLVSCGTNHPVIEIPLFEPAEIMRIEATYQGQPTVFKFCENGFLYEEGIFIFLEKETQKLMFTHLWKYEKGQVYLGLLYCNYMSYPRNDTMSYGILDVENLPEFSRNRIYYAKWYRLEITDTHVKFRDMVFER